MPMPEAPDPRPAASMPDAKPALVPARLVRGARGAVVAPHHLATAAGLAVLAAGGHAVDAAIATNAVLGVVMPNGCGIGGDAFWLVWDEAAGEQVSLNGSGRAPAGIDPDRLRAAGLDRIPLRGPLSITVPGAVRSWADAHARWGRLSREAVLGAAIEHAAAGFPAWDQLIAAVEGTNASIGDEPWTAGFRRVWRPRNRAWRPGEIVRLPALAATLRTLADEGFDAYYDGDLGVRITRGLVAAGGSHAVSDLRDHRSTWGSPIATTYRGVRVTTHPPNSSGILALEILNVLERFEPPTGARFDGRGWSDAAWIHHQLEAAKLVYADRDAHLADPAFREVPVERLLSREHAVVDGGGNAVSLIQSNAAGFGSGVVDPATGVHFQDRGASFSLDPEHPNTLLPGRRTAHTLLPGMLFREGERRPWVIGGSMGGDIQPQVHVQLVSALVDGGADIATAVAASRITVEPDGWLAPPVAVRADGHPADGVLAELRRLGHRVERAPFTGQLGHEHAIELVDGGPASGGSLAAVTDPRSAGLPEVR